MGRRTVHDQPADELTSVHGRGRTLHRQRQRQAFGTGPPPDVLATSQSHGHAVTPPSEGGEAGALDEIVIELVVARRGREAERGKTGRSEQITAALAEDDRVEG